MKTKPGAPEFFVQVPTPRTLFLRTFPPWQLVRFAVINLRMLGMIAIERRATAPRRDRPKA